MLMMRQQRLQANLQELSLPDLPHKGLCIGSHVGHLSADPGAPSRQRFQGKAYCRLYPVLQAATSQMPGSFQREKCCWPCMLDAQVQAGH